LDDGVNQQVVNTQSILNTSQLFQHDLWNALNLISSENLLCCLSLGKQALTSSFAKKVALISQETILVSSSCVSCREQGCVQVTKLLLPLKAAGHPSIIGHQ
jgi:hypothetical protein